jgi:hypothetical protein
MLVCLTSGSPARASLHEEAEEAEEEAEPAS